MRFHNLFTHLVFFLGTYIAHCQIVDDSTKVIYGTNTTKIFTQNTVYQNRVYFFDRDSMFARPFTPMGFKFDLKLKSPKDTILKVENPSDTITYFKNYATKNKKVSKEDSIRKAYPKRFYKNYYQYTRVDTSVTDIHNFNYIYVNRNIYQNQGLIGTPSKAVFFTAPTEIGYQTGFNTYDLYFKEPTQVQYFNSRSPYARIEYLANTGDENKIKLEFSRNVTRNWNIGFSYTRLNSNRQMSLTQRDRLYLASNQDLIFFTSFKSKNERYHFLGNFKYFVSKTNEQGGLVDYNQSLKSNLNQSRVPDNITNWPVYLNAIDSKLEPYRNNGSIYSRDRRVSYHFYHQYDIFNKGKLSVFHEFDRRNQKFTYSDPFAKQNLSSEIISGFYPKTRVKSDSMYTPTGNRYIAWGDTVNYNQEFAFTTNKFGLKGNILNQTWIGYLKTRNINWGNQLTLIKGDKLLTDFRSYSTWLFSDPKARYQLAEYSAGGEYLLNFGDSIAFRASGELIFANKFNDRKDSVSKNSINSQGNYILSANLKYKFLEFGASRSAISPNILYTLLDHDVFYWQKENYKSQQTTYIYGLIRYNFKGHYLELKPSFTNILNYTYLDTFIQPVQSLNAVNIYSADIFYQSNWGKLNWEIFAKFSKTNEYTKEIIRFPEAYINSKFYFKFQPKKKVWRQQFLVGLDIHYRSAYRGDAYMPAISQFYLQNNFLLNDYILIDLFINVKIRNARLFARMNQINSFFGTNAPNIISSSGYYISPGYVAPSNFLTFGVTWMLFD